MRLCSRIFQCWKVYSLGALDGDLQSRWNQEVSFGGIEDVNTTFEVRCPSVILRLGRVLLEGPKKNS